MAEGRVYLFGWHALVAHNPFLFPFMAIARAFRHRCNRQSIPFPELAPATHSVLGYRAISANYAQISQRHSFIRGAHELQMTIPQGRILEYLLSGLQIQDAERHPAVAAAVCCLQKQKRSLNPFETPPLLSHKSFCRSMRQTTCGCVFVDDRCDRDPAHSFQSWVIQFLDHKIPV